MLNENPQQDNEMASIPEAYEAPQIESVLKAEDLEREVAYAGNNIPTPA